MSVSAAAIPKTLTARGDLGRRARDLAELSPAPLDPSTGPGGACPRATLWKASCKSRACPVCGPRWARNQRTKIRHNLELLGRPVATIAITAPGREVLPWACTKNHKHAGTKGCKCEPRALREWCETLSWRWKKLRDAARLATKRELGEAPPWLLERVWEPQKRGAPHVHLAIPFHTWPERRVAECFRRHLARLAPEYGFGTVQNELNPIAGEHAARYLASYLTGRSSKKNSIRDNIGDPRLPRSLLWETPVLSSTSPSPRMVAMREARGVTLGTGITMRTLRRARHLWAVIEGLCEEFPRWSGLEEAVLAAAVFRQTNPKRAGPLGDFATALEWARACDRRQSGLNGGYLRNVWDFDRHEYVPNQALYEELTHLAFVATRAPVAEAA